MTHSLLLIDSDRLAMLVDEFADYGLISAPEIARRFGAKLAIDKNFKEILKPEDVVTWVNLNGNEEMEKPAHGIMSRSESMCSALL